MEGEGRGVNSVPEYVQRFENGLRRLWRFQRLTDGASPPWFKILYVSNTAKI
jgi:hypothetical protein